MLCLFYSCFGIFGTRFLLSDDVRDPLWSRDWPISKFQIFINILQLKIILGLLTPLNIKRKPLESKGLDTAISGIGVGGFLWCLIAHFFSNPEGMEPSIPAHDHGLYRFTVFDEQISDNVFYQLMANSALYFFIGLTAILLFDEDTKVKEPSSFNSEVNEDPHGSIAMYMNLDAMSEKLVA